MPPKKDKKAKQLTPLEDIDTSGLSLQQLQEFCVRVDNEIRKVEMESSELELERNKLKMLADVANSQLKEEKSRLRWTENDLEKEKEQFILNLLELNNNVRNVHVELEKECNGKMEDTFMKLQTITKSSLKSCNELVQDIRDLNSALRNCEVEQLSAVTTLKIDHDENRSKVLEHDSDVGQVRMVHQKNHRREVIKYTLHKCSKELEQLKKYKDNIIDQIMKQNDKDTLYTRHYYDKILDINRTVLEDLHAKYKTMKGNLTSFTKQISTLKADFNQSVKEIDANREQRRAMNSKMIDSDCKKEEVNAVRSEYRRRKENMVARKAEKMVLDEIMAISDNEIKQKRKPEEEELLSLQLRVIEQITFLEQLLDRLRAQVARLDQLIDFAEAKSPYSGRRMSCEQSTRVALKSLAFEAELELMEQRRISLINHINAQ